MTRIAVRAIVAFALIVAAGSIVLGQRGAETQDQPVPSFRSSAEAVQVTAIVTDAAGNPVTGLTVEDFEILEDGRPQPITTFSALDLPIERAERTGGGFDVLSNDKPSGRVYLIALDDMSADNALRTRFFLRRFIEKYFGPNDSAAVVSTTRGLRTDGQAFTTNPSLLLKAIDKFSGGSTLEDDPTGNLRVKNVMSSLKALTEMMAKLPGGRKAMIFMSQSLGPDSMCGCDADRLVGYRPGVLGGAFQEFNQDFQRAVSAATRGNIAIYPVNPAGLITTLAASGSFELATFTDASWQLDRLAHITGGFSVLRTNDFDAAFERLVRENSTYYVLGFNSGYERRDGRYIPIEVRVKRPGLQVRSIDGYLAPRDRPAPPRQTTLLAAVWNAVASPLTTSGLPMRVSAAPYKGKGKDATVAITMEIAANRLNLVERAGAYRGDLEIVFAVTDQKNKRRPLTRYRWALALKPETYQRVSTNALRVVAQLPLPKGKYQLRASAGGAAVAGSVVYDLDIPDFRDDFSLSGIALTSSQTGETLTVSPHARIDVNFPGAPTTAREFARSDTVTVYAEAYENRHEAHAVFFTIELRDERGAIAARDVLERRSGAKPKTPSAYGFAPGIVLEDVPPGRYTVHIEARSSLDKRSIQREIPITVR